MILTQQRVEEEFFRKLEDFSSYSGVGKGIEMKLNRPDGDDGGIYEESLSEHKKKINE